MASKPSASPIHRVSQSAERESATRVWAFADVTGSTSLTRPPPTAIHSFHVAMAVPTITPGQSTGPIRGRPLSAREKVQK